MTKRHSREGFEARLRDFGSEAHKSINWDTACVTREFPPGAQISHPETKVSRCCYLASAGGIRTEPRQSPERSEDRGEWRSMGEVFYEQSEIKYPRK